ncbi:restriction endonuclease subunit S [Photorhabdus laumondii]|uniref:restriction endonuclease subunit S n=1 Tax=Photorhabdus laumondii TaxID=2218628 RepID=UPI0025B1F18C|nr:restriction endonuclease subunit S [Photorhabdus laumondii]
MSNMSFMEKLLDGVEVEWMALGEIGELVRGNGLQKKDFTETGVPAIHYGQIYTYYGLSTTKTKSFVSPELAKKLRKVNTGDVVITNTSENLEDVGKALVYLGEQQAVTGGHATIFKPSSIILGKYFAYFTQTTEFTNEKRKYAKGAKVIDVSASDMAKIQIPIPYPEKLEKSLAFQTEIVRILDTFTELTAELTAELTVRKKQYNYYRDQLLSFEESEVEWKTLGEIATIGTGSRNTNEAVLDGQYPFFVRSQEPRAIDSFEFDETAIITAGDGVGVGKVFHYVSGKYALHQRAYRIVVRDDHFNSKFLFYYIRNNFAHYLTKVSVHASVTSLRKPMFEKYPIPIPPLVEQDRIVAILDKFDALTNSISEGLPREIELRQKQYEYYRDLLLNFPKPEVEA